MKYKVNCLEVFFYIIYFCLLVFGVDLGVFGRMVGFDLVKVLE